jgi:DMSO/TMAO reductase YedYZ molybdopterin-dependent catalytic subunit
MVFRSLGLRRPSVPQDVADRVPPGQYLTEKWPVLHNGPVPRFDPTLWDFRVYGEVEHELRFDWETFQQLPMETVHADMHCVTRWSKLDNDWFGVKAKEIIQRAGVKPEARFVAFLCEYGYTTSIHVHVLSYEDVLFAIKHNGEPLSPEHGYPLRAVVPKRYVWKSAKWIRAVEFLKNDRLGFWEHYGYNNNADPWKEERFA